MPDRKKIAIVGGGILGLTLAYSLAKLGQDVTIFEKSEAWGGLAAGIPFGDTTIDKYYHHWFRSDKEVLQLLDDLGLSDRLLWLPSNVGVFFEDEDFALSTPFDLLRFPKLSLMNRIRMGLVTFLLQNQRNSKKYEPFTALEWCRKYFGKQATDVIWEPLLRGKFGKHYSNISMSWLWARIHVRSTSRPSPVSKEQLGYLQGGFQVLIDRLVEKCRSLKVDLRSNAAITAHRYKKKHTLTVEPKRGREMQEFDKVVATVPGPVFTNLFKLSKTVREKIMKVKYIGATNLVLILKKSFMPYYWLNINDPSFPFLVVVEHTNFLQSKFYNGKIILYIAKYIDVNDKLFNISEKELLQLYLPFLKKINLGFSTEWIEQKFLFKSAYAQHIVYKGYQRPANETGVPGLLLANFSQIYPFDRGTNYAVAQADELVKLLID